MAASTERPWLITAELYAGTPTLRRIESSWPSWSGLLECQMVALRGETTPRIRPMRRTGGGNLPRSQRLSMKARHSRDRLRGDACAVSLVVRGLQHDGLVRYPTTWTFALDDRTTHMSLSPTSDDAGPTFATPETVDKAVASFPRTGATPPDVVALLGLDGMADPR